MSSPLGVLADLAVDLTAESETHGSAVNDHLPQGAAMLD